MVSGPRIDPRQFQPAPRLALLGALVASLIALGVYLPTLAPSVTWKHDGSDSGDLVSAAFTLGIPHPPGYPLFTLLASPFAHLPGVEAAAGVGILVAFAGALAVFVLATAGSALIAAIAPKRLAWLVPAAAALGFAFAPALWSQATIAEVYTLNLLLVSVILWAMVSDSRYRVPIAAAAFGLGLAHHLSILLFAPGAWLVLRPSRRDLRSLALVCAPLLLYAYLPLRAAFHPPINWGNPSTLEGFLWEVTAAPYRPYLFGETFAALADRVAVASRLLFEQFTPVGVALGLWGLARLASVRPRIAQALVLNLAIVVGYSVVYASRDSFIYLLPAFAVVLLWLVYGAVDVMSMLRPAAQLIPIAVIAAFPLYNLWANFLAMNLSTDREAYDYARGIVDRLPRDAVIFAEGDEARFSLVYYRYVIAYGRSDAAIVSQGLLQYSWYYDELRGAMSEPSLASSDAIPDWHGRAVEIAGQAFSRGRLVCFDKSSPTLPEFQYAVRDTLSCIVARQE